MSAPHSNGTSELGELHRLAALAVRERSYALAASLYERALPLDGANAALLSDYGVVLRALGRPRDAVAQYDKALALRPDFVAALCNRGNAYRDLKRPHDALASFDGALIVEPGRADALCGRGYALLDAGRNDEALASFDAAIDVRPDYGSAYLGRGNAQLALGRADAAVASYDSAIKHSPASAEAFCNRGVALRNLGKLEAALASLNEAITLRGDYAEAFSNRGVVERDLGSLKESLSSCDEAIRLRPGYAEAYANRGNAVLDLGRIEEAVTAFDVALSLDPNLAEARWNKGIALLTAGDFERGWPLYEWRWRKRGASAVPAFPQPLWTGGPIRGQTILLHSEQGYGDTIQFCRFATSLARLDARVVFGVPRELIPALRGLEGVAQWVSEGDPLPPFDTHCPLLSLPAALRLTVSSVPSTPAYLRPQPERTSHWSQILGHKKAPRIGIAWSGRPTHKNDRNRSIALAKFRDALPGGAEYVSLQKDVQGEDRAALEKHSSIRHFGERLRDFGDTAALCALMDLVVCVDTSVAHLAGALGKETWVLLPSNADWRWLADRIDTPWYPSMRLYRQPNWGNWTAALAAVRTDLERRTDLHRTEV